VSGERRYKFVVPESQKQLAYERIGSALPYGIVELIGLDSGGPGPGMVVLGPALPLTISAVPAAHEAVERDGKGHCKCLGYIFEFSGGAGRSRWTVYHSGDTMLYDGIVDQLRPFHIDVALLPINGRAPERRVAGNLNGREAARLAKEIGAKLVIPCHYDMFEFNTADPREQFIPECERIGQRYKVLRAGERLTWS